MTPPLISALYYSYHHQLPFAWGQVLRLEGEGNYTIFVLIDGTKQLSSKSLCVYEPHMPKEFVRVHKSCIVNSGFVLKVDKEKRYVLMADNVEIQIARRRLKQVQKFNSIILQP